jgi:hypothetical protein
MEVKRLTQDRILSLKPLPVALVKKYSLDSNDMIIINKARKGIIQEAVYAKYFNIRQIVANYVSKNIEFKPYAKLLIYVLESIDCYALGYHITKQSNGFVQLHSPWRRYQ